MGIEEHLRIDRLHGADPAAAPGRAQPSGDPTEFRRLLEQLEQLAQQRGAEPATGAGEDVAALQDALRQADADFAQVMDLRARLEDAFRRVDPDAR